MCKLQLTSTACVVVPNLQPYTRQDLDAYSSSTWLAHQEMPQSQHDANPPDGAVNIMLIHILSEVHHCRGFRHAEHALKVPHSHRHAMTDSCLFAQGGIHLQVPGG